MSKLTTGPKARQTDEIVAQTKAGNGSVALSFKDEVLEELVAAAPDRTAASYSWALAQTPKPHFVLTILDKHQSPITSRTSSTICA